MKKKFLYVNGDCWLWGPNVIRFLSEEYTLFDDYFVINHALNGSSNLSIINRTKKAIEDLKEYDITPTVIIGFGEVAKDLANEFKMLLPDRKRPNDLNEYLENLLLHQVSTLDNILADCPRYICSAWTKGVTGNKNIIDFVSSDAKNYPHAYTVSESILSWIEKNRKLFNFTESSISDAFERSANYQKALMTNDIVSPTIHLIGRDPKTVEVYTQWFKHVLTKINN